MSDTSEARGRQRTGTVLTLCLGLLLIVAGAANGQGLVPGFPKTTPGFIDDAFNPVISGLTAQGLRTLVQPDGCRDDSARLSPVPLRV